MVYQQLLYSKLCFELELIEQLSTGRSVGRDMYYKRLYARTYRAAQY